MNRESQNIEQSKPDVSEKTSEKNLAFVRENQTITIGELADKLHITGSSVERSIEKLKNEGKLLRIGPDKGGRWEVTSKET